VPTPLSAGAPGEPQPPEAPRQPALQVKVQREMATTLPAWDLVPPAQLLAFRRRGA
jgi:hypothetical protein